MIHKVTKLVHRSTLKSGTVDLRAMKSSCDHRSQQKCRLRVLFVSTAQTCVGMSTSIFCWCVSSLLTAFRFNRAKHFGMPGTSRDRTNNTKKKKKPAGKGKQSKPDPRGFQMLQKFCSCRNEGTIRHTAGNVQRPRQPDSPNQSRNAQ